MSDCDHPLENMTLDTGRSGGRGQTETMIFECSQCEARISGSLGIQAFVEALKRERSAMWRAVVEAGGRRRDAVASTTSDTSPGPRTDCPHYVAWLYLEVPGTGSGGRGLSGACWFVCRGCKQRLPMVVGLSLFLDRLKEDWAALRAAIADLRRERGDDVL